MLCLLSERSIRYIILSPRTPIFLPLPLRGKFSSDSRTRRLLRNLLIVLLFFHYEGYKKHPVCKKTTILPVNREKRKRFCRSKLMWTVRNHWKKVIFSDETKIEIGNNRKVYVWRKVDEKLRPECNGLYQGRNYKTLFSNDFSLSTSILIDKIVFFSLG
jgi:hypothetical protein